MTPEPWLYSLLIAVVGIQVLTVAYAFRFGRGSGSGTVPADAAGRSAASDGVVCPECGAENDPGYRYCGHCVSELPGATQAGRRPTSPLGGRSL